MHKKSLSFIVTVCCCVGVLVLSKFNVSATRTLRMDITNNYELESSYTSDVTSTGMISASDADQYINYINVPSTDQMPTLYFELTGRKENDDYNEYLTRNLYYPDRLVITADGTVIQELEFDENDFSPCGEEDFGFEYGDFRFDGYGGFRILCSSLGKNPIWLFWVWDKTNNCFVSYPDLEMVGYINFDYINQEINVSSTGSADLHEFLTYKYVNDKLSMIKKVIDADQDGYRKVYKLIDGELELIKTTESQLK